MLSNTQNNHRGEIGKEVLDLPVKPGARYPVGEAMTIAAIVVALNSPIKRGHAESAGWCAELMVSSSADLSR